MLRSAAAASIVAQMRAASSPSPSAAIPAVAALRISGTDHRMALWSNPVTGHAAARPPKAPEASCRYFIAPRVTDTLDFPCLARKCYGKCRTVRLK